MNEFERFLSMLTSGKVRKTNESEMPEILEQDIQDINAMVFLPTGTGYLIYNNEKDKEDKDNDVK